DSWFDLRVRRYCRDGRRTCVLKDNLSSSRINQELPPMPIHLPPINRRRFLAATAAGLLGVRSVRAAAPADEHCWALLSDPHIAGDRTTVFRGAKLVDKLAATVKEVLTLPTLPANVLINGDCALKLGFPGDYATFTDLVQPLREAGMTLRLTLGNH